MPKDEINLSNASERPASVYTYVAQVQYAFPDRNLYVVIPQSNGTITQERRLASGPGNTTGNPSSSIQQAYSPGDIVLISSDNGVPGAYSPTDYIVGPAAVFNAEHTDQDSTESLLSSVFSKVRGTLGVLRANISKFFGKSSAVVSGDFELKGSHGTAVRLLKHLLSINSGHSCSVEMDSILNRVRITADSLSFVSPVKDGFTGISLKTFAEALYTALDRSEGSYEGHSPKYRHRAVSGDLVRGWMTSVGVPSQDMSTMDTVYGEKKDYSGNSVVMSAKGMELRKTYDIPSPVQTTEMDGITKYLKETEEFPQTQQEPVGVSWDKFLMDKTLNMFSKNPEAEFPGVKNNRECWTVDTGEAKDQEGRNISKEFNSWRKTSNEVPKFQPAGSNQYSELPESLQVVDPHTGNTYTYFKSTSGIRQDPDGSILLYDGYGSEIRMSRGNIIISPAADLIFRPGRDLHSMAGRHTAVTSQEDVVIHSSNKDVYVKAQRDLNIAAGIGGEGKTILDHRGKDGAVLKSVSGMSLTGSDVYIGVSQDKPSSTAPDKSTPGSGKMVISGGADLLMQAKNAAVSGQNVVLFGHKENGTDAAGLVVSADGTSVLGGEIGLSGSVVLGRGTSSARVLVGDAQYNLTTPQDVSVKIESDVSVAGEMSVDSVVSNNVKSVAVFCSNGGNTPMRRRITETRFSRRGFNTASAILRVPMAGSWTDQYVYGREFQYPSTEELGVSSSYIVPGMLWQAGLSGGSVWKEPEISSMINESDKSMVYPGKTAWEDGKVTLPGYKEAELMKGYKTNGRR